MHTHSTIGAPVRSATSGRGELEWAQIIRGDLEGAVEGFIAAGAHLQQAKLSLAHGRFLPLLKLIGLHDRAAERLMKIAGNTVLANPTHGSKLPASMRTLYELATLPAELLEAKLNDGTITPSIERRDVEKLKKGGDGVGGKTIARTKLTLKGVVSLDLEADTVEHLAALIVASIPDDKARDLAFAIIHARKRRVPDQRRAAP